MNYYNRRLLDIMKQIASINNQDERERVIQRVNILKAEVALKVKMVTDASTSGVVKGK